MTWRQKKKEGLFRFSPLSETSGPLINWGVSDLRHASSMSWKNCRLSYLIERAILEKTWCCLASQPLNSLCSIDKCTIVEWDRGMRITAAEGCTISGLAFGLVRWPGYLLPPSAIPYDALSIFCTFYIIHFLYLKKKFATSSCFPYDAYRFPPLFCMRLVLRRLQKT